MIVVASFRRKEDAELCLTYLQGQSLATTVKITELTASFFPWNIAVDLKTRDAQIAVAFARGFAAAMSGASSYITDVGCTSDARDRWLRRAHGAAEAASKISELSKRRMP